MLYKRNLLLFDRETDSLWSQLLSEAVTGPLAGTRIELLPAANTTWEEWRDEHPSTLVLSFDTGYSRTYAADPYEGYPISRRPALFISTRGATKIYPFSELEGAPSPLVDEVAGRSVTILFDRRSRTATVGAADARQLKYFVSFLDDLKAFYPESEIFQASRQ